MFPVVSLLLFSILFLLLLKFLIKKLFGGKKTSIISESKYMPLESNDVACPYCSFKLERPPGRKKACPQCKKDIYVRTHPRSKKRILVREDQLLEIEEQWAIANGTHDSFLAVQKEKEKMTASLRAKFGQEPSENDVQWGILNKQLLKHAKNRDWGLYRNDKLDMGRLLKKENKLAQALDTFLEVCYLDVNGPMNRGGLDAPDLRKQFPDFDVEMEMLAPGVVGFIESIGSELSLTTDDIRSRFLKIAERTHAALRLPVSPSVAWRKLYAELDNIENIK